MASSNIDLFVDEAYLIALLNEEPIPVSDEKYAEELHLQEALYSSSSTIPLFHTPKTEYDQDFNLQQSRYYSSSSYPLFHTPKTENVEEFHLQEALYSLFPPFPLFHTPKTEDDENRASLKNREIGQSSNAQPTFCGICMDYKQNLENFKVLTICNHKFCTDCVTKYVASKIRENCGLIECPDPKCKQAIEPEICSTILPKEVFGRWENTLFEAMIPGGQKFYCPYKNCSVLMVDDGAVEVRESECPSCRRLFCAKCQVPWHVGITCEEFEVLGKDEREMEDIMVMKMAKDEKWMRCPKCRIYVEKIDGCVYMTCRCNHEFCYQCGDKWSTNHAHSPQ